MEWPIHAGEKMKPTMNFAGCVGILLVLACMSCFAQSGKTDGNADTRTQVIS